MLRVVHRFLSNQGFLLSGVVAFYTLMTIVPLLIIALIVLIDIIEEQNSGHS